MIHFLVVWLILALIDIGLAFYSLKLNKKLFPKLDYTELEGERNALPCSFVKKLGLLPGIVAAYLFMVVVIVVFVYLLFKFVDPFYITIAFGLIIGLDLTLIFVSHAPSIKLSRSLIKASNDNNLKKDVDDYLEYTEKRHNLLKKITSKNR